jgi:hypothetical protein
MDIVDLQQQAPAILQQAAALLVHDFDEPRGWPTIEASRDEVASVVRDGFARGMVEADLLLRTTSAGPGRRA